MCQHKFLFASNRAQKPLKENSYFPNIINFSEEKIQNKLIFLFVPI